MNPGRFDPDGLRNEGFEGFISISEARVRTSSIPAAQGVYAVVREVLEQPTYVRTSTGGWFKGRDPSVPIDKLEKKWIETAHVLYIGKAGAGGTGTRGLRTRLGEYLSFGAGQPIGHWGGRYLWHLADSEALLLAWKPCSDPTHQESLLLDAFAAVYGALPFANLRR